MIGPPILIGITFGGLVMTKRLRLSDRYRRIYGHGANSIARDGSEQGHKEHQMSNATPHDRSAITFRLTEAIQFPGPCPGPGFARTR